MILRNFLFLDTETMADYLSTLEGSIVEGPIDQSEVKKSEKGGKAGFKAVEGSLASETSTERRQKLVITDAARFQRLYELMDGEQLVQYLEAFDSDIWGQIRRGELLEIQANLRLPAPFLLVQTAEGLSPLLDLMAAFGQEPLGDPQALQALDGMRAVGKMNENQPVPLIFQAVGAAGFTFVTHLPRQHLRCGLSDLQGEATVLGKVQRIIQKGQKLEAFSLVPALTGLLPALNRHERRKSEKEAADKQIIEMVSGPAMVLTPVAVYR